VIGQSIEGKGGHRVRGAPSERRNADISTSLALRHLKAALTVDTGPSLVMFISFSLALKGRPRRGEEGRRGRHRIATN
jgi:hypothetical protein